MGLGIDMCFEKVDVLVNLVFLLCDVIFCIFCDVVDGDVGDD